jgi:outer membrane receptor for ferrienterochelin and colicin
MTSSIFEPGLKIQDLWSLFLEDAWKPLDRWEFTYSGRLDRHPLTPLSFSQHGSAVFAASGAQTIRLSAGTSFRDPTLLENYFQFAQAIPNPGAAPLTNPPFTAIQAQIIGNHHLDPEKMFQVELAHDARFGAVQTTASIYYYKITDLINQTSPALVSAVAPTVVTQSTYFNHGGTRALGFQFGAETKPNSWLDVFANYSYQQLKDDDPSIQTDAQSAPRHKVNAGFSTKRRGLTTSLWSDWVGATYWNQSEPGTPTVYGKVPDYFLLNGRIGYAFSGRWDGWEIALSGFDMLDHAHYEIMPAASSVLPGQYGEIVRSRWTGTASYRF